MKGEEVQGEKTRKDKRGMKQDKKRREGDEKES